MARQVLLPFARHSLRWRLILLDLVPDAHEVFCTGRSDDSHGRLFYPRRYSRMHSGTERRVHIEVTWFSVCCAFDFSYATVLVIITHQLFVLASARYDQKGLTVKVLIRRSEVFRYAAHIFPSGRFGGTRAARRCAEHIEDHDVADAGMLAPGAGQL